MELTGIQWYMPALHLLEREEWLLFNMSARSVENIISIVMLRVGMWTLLKEFEGLKITDILYN